MRILCSFAPIAMLVALCGVGQDQGTTGTAMLCSSQSYGAAASRTPKSLLFRSQLARQLDRSKRGLPVSARDGLRSIVSTFDLSRFVRREFINFANDNTAGVWSEREKAAFYSRFESQSNLLDILTFAYEHTAHTDYSITCSLAIPHVAGASPSGTLSDTWIIGTRSTLPFGLPLFVGDGAVARETYDPNLATAFGSEFAVDSYLHKLFAGKGFIDFAGAAVGRVIPHGDLPSSAEINARLNVFMSESGLQLSYDRNEFQGDKNTWYVAASVPNHATVRAMVRFDASGNVIRTNPQGLRWAKGALKRLLAIGWLVNAVSMPGTTAVLYPAREAPAIPYVPKELRLRLHNMGHDGVWRRIAKVAASPIVIDVHDASYLNTSRWLLFPNGLTLLDYYSGEAPHMASSYRRSNTRCPKDYVCVDVLYNRDGVAIVD